MMTPIKTDPFIFQWSVDAAGHEWKPGLNSQVCLFERGGFERKVRVYYPLKKAGLFAEFAELKPKRDAILQFANRYGDLGADTDGDLLVEGGRFKVGSKLTTWKNEIGDMNALVSLWKAKQQRSSNKLESVMKWVKGVISYRISTPRGTIEQVLAHPDTDRVLLERFRPGDLLQPARYALQREINKRLDRTRTVPQLIWCPGDMLEEGTFEPDGIQRVVFQPSSLLAAMWLQFAQAVTGEFQLRRCEVCGKYFQLGPGGRRADAITCGDACRQRKRRVTA